jgi:hypothetical protein
VNEEILWRVGYRADPLAFTPPELCSWHHRFDDPARRFRTLYCAEHPETALREVLADFRPKASALQAFAEKFGDDALEEVTAGLVTTIWREQHLLTSTRMVLDGDLIDLTDAAARAELESRHAALLVEHDLEHLDFHELTTRQRPVTQAIAGDLYDRGVAALRFPSSLDGKANVVLFEGRGELEEASDPIALTEPPPGPLVTVCTEWGLRLESIGDG